MLAFATSRSFRLQICKKFINNIFGRAEKNSFKGGLSLKTHKDLAQKFKELPLLKNYELSLRTNRGFLRAIKKEGDRVLGGEVIAVPENPLDCLLHSPSSGIIKEITKKADFFGEAALSIKIESDNLEQIQLLKPLNLENSPQDLLKRISDCGILGLGGAGFPAAKKLSKTANLLIINGAECEPYLTCDELLMSLNAQEIILGAKVISKIIGAEKIIFAIEDDKTKAIEKVKNALQGDKLFDLKIIPTKYPSGNTRQLIEILLNKRVSPKQHLNDLGIIIHNVATIFAIYEAIFKGKPLIERFITLSGENLKTPQVLKAKIGSSGEDLIKFCGGAKPNSRFILGGPMMGQEIFNLNAGIFKTSAAILALAKIKEFEHLPCIRCSRCAEVCPLNLLPMQFYWFYRANNQQRLKEERLFDCIECGLCASVCPSKIPLTQYFQGAKAKIKEQETKKKFAEYSKQRHENKIKRLAKEAKKREELAQKQREELAQRQEKISPVQKFNPSSELDENQQRLKAIEEAKQRAAARRAKRMEEKSDKNK